MQQIENIKEKIHTVLRKGEILLIVPPFGSISDVSLGSHILQSLAEEKGYKTDILYLNILLAAVIGVEYYQKIYDCPLFWMLGERMYARSAYDLPPLGKHPEWCANEGMSIKGSQKHVNMFFKANSFDLNEYLMLEQICQSFIDEVLPVIISLNYKIIGCSAIVGQTNCSVTFLSGVKKYSPETITIIGGNNCEGEMADGIASLSNKIDYVFSGESETSFLKFLEAYSSGKLPVQRIITGEPLNNLDTIPLPNYKFYSHQSASFLGNNAPKIKIWNETSRGCWWAEKSRCTFCGIPHISYRQKSINRVLHDLERMRNSYPNMMLFMADNVMPFSYQKGLIPALSKKKERPALAYHTRAKFNLQDLVNFKTAKIDAMLPGIESFSTNLLKLMNKGITGRQNLLFLRNASSVGIYCDWFLLWGIPGDSIADYKEILRILPLISHLQPPRDFFPLVLMRFSPYFENQYNYKISVLYPWNVYNMIYPEWSDIEKLAYYYIGVYPCESYENQEIIREIGEKVSSWKKKWKKTKLRMSRIMGTFVIFDNRDFQKIEKKHVLQYRQAREIMTSHVYQNSENIKWAVEEKLGVILDSWYVPLVTASPEMLLEFEERHNP